MEQKKNNKIIWLIMLGGFLLRVILILAARYDISSHDLTFHPFEGCINGGHLGYIEYLLQYRHLPDFDPSTVWGFYNPPFYYIISALWMGLLEWFGIGHDFALTALRAPTLFYATVSVYLFIKILEEFKINGRTLVLLSAFVSFFPTFTWLSATLTSDGLLLMLMLLAILFSIRWYKEPTMGRIIITALAIGLGMMTKLNAAYVSFGTAFLFIARFAQTLKGDRARVKSYLCQFAVFALICFPLGLFWPIRNYIRFDMPLNYIQYVPSASQVIDSATAWERLGIPRLEQLGYACVQFDTSLDTNIWLTMIRTALFDEGDMMSFPTKPLEIFGTTYFLYSLLMALVMNACYVLCLIKKKYGMGGWAKTYTMLLYIPLILSYIIFCFDFPCICTMNYRYIAVLTVVPVISAGLVFDERMRLARPKSYKVFSTAIVLHCAASAFTYLQQSVTLFAAG